MAISRGEGRNKDGTMTRTKKPDAVRIDSLPIAAAIISLGTPLCGIEGNGGSGRRLFVFADPAAADLAGQYATGTLQVNAREFMRAFDQVRDIVRGRVEVSR